MKTGQHRMSKEEIDIIIQMRKDGYSVSTIAKYFNKDHTSIMYHCRKLWTVEKTRIKIVHIEVGDRMDRSKIIHEDSEVFNTGKDYIDYLEEEKNRNWRSRDDIAKLS